MTSTATIGTQFASASIEDIERAVRELAALPRRDQWIVIDPYGQMINGTIEQITPWIIRQHPSMQFNPIRPMEFK